jgi:hypothetical protein
MRKSLLATSAIDVTMAAIMKLEEMSPLSDEQIFVKNQLYQSVVKAMSHSAVLLPGLSPTRCWKGAGFL